MFPNLLLKPCLTALESQTDLLWGGATRVSGRAQTATTATAAPPKATNRGRQLSLVKTLALAPLVAVVVVLALTGWLPVVLLALVLLLPALAPFVLVALGILATQDVERRQAALTRTTTPVLAPSAR